MPELLDYQVINKKELLATLQEPSKIHTFVSSMSSGKTAINCSLIGDIWRQKRVWIIVNRIELVNQWRAEMKRFAPLVTSIGEITANKKFYRAQVVIVQVQTLRRYLDKVNPALAPDVVIYDEAHETAFEKIANKLSQKFKFKQINLTATPVRHGGSTVQYDDLFPRENWIIGATAKYLISIGRWKKPDWRLASADLAEKTADAFSGMKISKGDYDDTSQASVMIRLLPDHIAEWKANGGEVHSCVWYCVNADHARRAVEALVALGRTAAVVLGDSTDKERSDAIKNFNAGIVTDLVNCQCLTTGFDAPIASCAVWLRRTLSIGLFCQMAGRVLRKHLANEIGLLLDLACNLANHPFPEDIDWLTDDFSKKIFRDPTMVICKACGYRHQSIPTPLPPSKEWQWKTSLAVFANSKATEAYRAMQELQNEGDTHSDEYKAAYKIYQENIINHHLESPLVCHDCNANVYGDRSLLEQYSEWLSTVSAAHNSGARIPRHKQQFAGVSIGKNEAYDRKDLEILTPSILYNSLIWQEKELPSMTRNTLRDRREFFEKIYQGATERVDAKTLQLEKISLLHDKAKQHIELYPLSSVRTIAVPNQRYSTALLYCYVNNKSPISALSYYGIEGYPDKELAPKVIKRICGGNDRSKALCWQWLTDWRDHHKNFKDHAKAGIVDKWIKTCF